MDGILLINKPPRLTSHDVVQKVRKILGIQKVGHFGTLDPMATGLMIVAVGKATRFFSFYSKLNKVYRGQIRLGFATNTYDADGTPSTAEKANFPSEETLLKYMADLTGEIEQIPPLFSAKKFKGKPLYVLARKNQDVKPRPVTIQIYYFRLVSYDPPFIEFEAACSSGSYMRSLAHDLGQSLQCGAHLSQLKRTAIGDFHIQSSITLEALGKLVQETKIEKIFIPLESVLPEFPKIILNEEGVALAKNGNMVFSEHIHALSRESFNFPDTQTEPVQICRLFNQDGRLLALGKFQPEKNGLHPYLVIDSDESEV
ncbi:MAG TPA: tRNA pseudouridine(55) synthase TruB [Candidatus Heimdallarchaeota archaeon]|jgi:tRNA pseudouridine55 synthase|nr:tRNA pseudouridine(55) synthase TruB [Candidatus Heimdallarchaeota archaeon]